MDFSPEEFDEILNIFRGETEEIVQKLNNNLLQLESNPDNEDLLVYLFRDAHSLKGAARMIGFNNIQRLAHKAEDVLGLAKEKKIKINREISDALYNAIDLMSELIQESVKLKKEYYTDDIQKQIDKIDEIVKRTESKQKKQQTPAPEKTLPEEKIPHAGEPDESQQKSINKINAMLSESYLLLNNMAGEEGSSYIETFDDIIKQLKEEFYETDYSEIKKNLNEIEQKIDFVMRSSNIVNNDEVEELNLKLINILNNLNSIYEAQNIEKLDIKGLISKKIHDEEEAANEQENNQTTEQSSEVKQLLADINYIKDELGHLETNLSQIPKIQAVINDIIETNHKTEITSLAKKLDEILEILKNTKKLPEKEIIAVLKQCFSSAEKMAQEDNEQQEDISLVLQRLDIIKQMLDLNSSVNPLANLSTTLDASPLPVKKAQDFFNSFETTSIRTLRVDSKKLDRLVNQMGELIIGRIKHKKIFQNLKKCLWI